MEDEDKREDDNRRRQTRGEKSSEFVIKIPSYQEVLESSQSQTAPPSSLFKPSPSFSEAFNFIKKSEFYSPPPPPPPPLPSSASSQHLHASDTSASSRQLGHSQVLPSSTAAASSSSASSIPQNRNAILVGNRQKGNPLLKHIRNVRWAFADVVCDFLLGQSACALYLSLRYHLLHPDYLYYRIRELQKNFKLRIILCHVDVEDVVKPLLEVTKTALLHDCTLLCGWSLEECGRYLETVKVYENKPPDIIQGQMDTDYLSRLTHALTTARHVNKTDVVTLGSTFGVCLYTSPAIDFTCPSHFFGINYLLIQSLSHIMDASMEDLARCPGIGERKVKRLYDTFNEPFKRVVPKHISIPETSTQSNAEPCLATEGKEEENEEDASKCGKKEPELTTKSALSAAFAKYSDKISKRNNLQPEKVEESSSAVEAKAKNTSCSEEAAN